MSRLWGIQALVRALKLERVACSTCPSIVRRRKVTILADGRLICKQCLHKTISSGIQAAIANLPGAKEYRAFALEPGDRRIGSECAFCGLELGPLDAVCAMTEERLAHLTCTQLARRVSRVMPQTGTH